MAYTAVCRGPDFRAWRLAAGVSLPEAARELGCAVGTVRLAEEGGGLGFPAETLRNIGEIIAMRRTLERRLAEKEKSNG